MPNVKIEEIAPEAKLNTSPASAATTVVSSVPSSGSAVTLISATASRSFFMIYNDSTESLYVKFGTGASTADFTVKILAGGYFESASPIYTGLVSGIWSAENGNALVTELTE